MLTKTRLGQIAEEHALLEQNITNYDHAPTELRETIDLLKGLQRDLNIREARMEKVIEKRKAEHRGLDRLQHSSRKRFFIRMKSGGKEGLERRMEEEEREYIMSAQIEHDENLAILELRAAEEQANMKIADLESRIMVHEEILSRLDELCELAFDGPTPDFPEEDMAEKEVKEADAYLETVQDRLGCERSVLVILDEATAIANKVVTDLQNVNFGAIYDVWKLEGVLTSKVDDLSRAQTLVVQVQRLLDRARGLQPSIKEIQIGQIAFSDWLYITLSITSSRSKFQQKVRRTIESIRDYQEHIIAEYSASEARIKVLVQDANDAQEFLKSRRRQLVATRRELLRRIHEDALQAPGVDAEDVSPIPASHQPDDVASEQAMSVPQDVTSMQVLVHEEQPEDMPPPPPYSSVT